MHGVHTPRFEADGHIRPCPPPLPRTAGIRMKKAELEALLAEVDHDGSGEVRHLGHVAMPICVQAQRQLAA